MTERPTGKGGPGNSALSPPPPSPPRPDEAPPSLEPSQPCRDSSGSPTSPGVAPGVSPDQAPLGGTSKRNPLSPPNAAVSPASERSPDEADDVQATSASSMPQQDTPSEEAVRGAQIMASVDDLISSARRYARNAGVDASYSPEHGDGGATSDPGKQPAESASLYGRIAAEGSPEEEVGAAATDPDRSGSLPPSAAGVGGSRFGSRPGPSTDPDLVEDTSYNSGYVAKAAAAAAARYVSAQAAGAAVGNRTQNTSGVGRDVSGVVSTPSQRALVAYDGSDAMTPYGRSLVPPTGRREGSSANDAYSPHRHAEVRAMLITAERELAEVREECAKRGTLIDGLEAALARERATTQSMRERHAAQMEAEHVEHAGQTKQLREQIHVLKLVSESAMSDKAKAAEEAERRKKELLALLDRERQEKSSIMADYREQTESLIAEQGKEITSLRGTLDKIKEEYDQLARDHQALVEERNALQQQLQAAASQQELDRLEAAKRLREVQTGLQTEKEALQQQLSAKQEDYLRESTKQAAKRQELTDQLQRAQEQQRLQAEEHQHTVESLRQMYRRDVEGLQQELASAKKQREKDAEEHRKELENAVQQGERAAEVLQGALVEARADKERAVSDGFKQREELQVQHRAKVAQIQTVVDALTKEVAQERGERKDVEAELEVMKVRAANAQKTIETLTSEMEAAQADFRAKERASEQSHQVALEELRGRVRSAATDLSYSQQQVRQQAVEQQRLRDDLAAKVAELAHVKEEQKRTAQNAEERLRVQEEAWSAKEQEYQKALEQTRSQKAKAEADGHRLERVVSDMDSRLLTTTRQLDEERKALESVSRQLQDAKVAAEDLRQALSHKQQQEAGLAEEKRALERDLQQSKLYSSELENAVQMEERRRQELQQDQARQAKANDAKLAEEAQRHKAEVAALRMLIEQLRGETTKAKEVTMAKETALQQLREEVGQLHREAALREGALQEELEDMKDAHGTQMQRMDDLLNGLRSDLAKSQAMCTQYQRELAHFHRDVDGQRADLEAALEQSEAARAKLQDDAKYREQLNQELQGTVRLLTARLDAYEEDAKRAQEELTDTAKKIQDAHTLIGRKDALIGQLNAKVRAYEARGLSL